MGEAGIQEERPGAGRPGGGDSRARRPRWRTPGRGSAARRPTPSRTTPPEDADGAEDQDEASQELLPDPDIVFRSRPVVGAGYMPPKVRRRERRSVRRVAREREGAWRKVLMRERRAAMEAEKQARKDASYLPATGEKGPHAGRSLFRLKVEPHRATTDTLSVAYPFLAEAGLGSEGALIGHDSWSGAAFCFDVWNLYDREVITNPNMLLAGIIGRGKSALAKSLSTRSIAFGRKVYVPGDPKGEWTPVARAVDGASIALGPGMTTRINPLDEGPRPAYWIDSEGGRQPMDDEMWRSVVTNRRRDLVRALTEQALGRDLQSVEMTALFAAVDAVVREQETPILPQVVHRMMYPTEEVNGSSVDQLLQDGRAAAHALNRVVSGDLAGLFDGPSTTRFDPSLPDADHGHVAHVRQRHPDRARHELRLSVDGGRARGPRRRAAPGRLRRGVAADEARRAARADAEPMEALTALGDRKPHGHPPTLRSRRRR